jgi:membrane protease YdiL (CAAX protease family)
VGPEALGTFRGVDASDLRGALQPAIAPACRLPPSVAGGMLSAMAPLRPALAELMLAFLGLLVGITVMLVLGSLGVLPRDEAGQWFRFIGGPAVTVIAALFYRWAARRVDDRAEPAEARELEARLDIGRAGTGRSAAALGLGIAIALGGSMVLGTIMELVGVPVQEQIGIQRIVEAAKRGEATFEFATLVVSAVLFAPLAEEWLFRGLLFRRMRAVGNRPIAYALSALAFAAIHTNPAGFVIYLWLGLVFAFAYERTGRLWVPIGVHMGNNAVALFGLVYAS